MSDSKKTMFGFSPVTEEELEEAARTANAASGDEDPFGDDWDIDEASIRKVSGSNPAVGASPSVPRGVSAPAAGRIAPPQLQRPPASGIPSPGAPEAASATKSGAGDQPGGWTVMLGGDEFREALEQAAAGVRTGEGKGPGTVKAPSVRVESSGEAGSSSASAAAPDAASAPAPAPAGGTMMLGGADFARALEEASASVDASSSAASAQVASDAEESEATPFPVSSQRPEEPVSTPDFPVQPSPAVTGGTMAMTAIAFREGDASAASSEVAPAPAAPVQGSMPASAPAQEMPPPAGSGQEAAPVADAQVMAPAAVPSPEPVPPAGVGAFPLADAQSQPTAPQGAPMGGAGPAPFPPADAAASAQETAPSGQPAASSLPAESRAPAGRSRAERPVIGYAQPTDRPMPPAEASSGPGSGNSMLLLVAASLGILIVVVLVFLLMR